MNKLYLWLMLLFGIILFYGCENSVEEEDFPFEVRLVIRGILEPGKPVTNIYIGRTMPIAAQFSQGFANLANASAVILHNNTFYPLRHTTNGLYRNDTLIISTGETYQLVVQWEDKLATAETTIPNRGIIERPVVKSAISGTGSKNYVESSVLPWTNEVYAATWVSFFSGGAVAQEDSSIASVIKRGDNGLLKVTTNQVPSNLGTQNLGLRMYIYDAPFYDYYYSQGSNRTSDLVFGQPQNNIKWNVQADGIGMFIGRRDTLLSIN
ncbi:MAG: DUF4249 family protein [Ignavibacteriaceae bacterium]|nr:DUF4249 family protein [Ignavibacteriaceae bacterium]